MFKKKSAPAGAEAAQEAKPGPYDHLGPQAAAEITRFSKLVGKEWQAMVMHRNFDRSPFEVQLRLFLEKMEREARGGKFGLLLVLLQQGHVAFNDVAFEAMSRAVAVVGAAKLLGGFEKLGRAVS